MSDVNQLKFIGSIQRIFEPTTGTTIKGNNWKAVEFLVTETKEYPQSAVFKLFGVGDKIDKVENFIKYRKVGDDVEVSFNLKSKEYKEKFYNSLDAWTVFSPKSDNKEQAKAPSKVSDAEVIEESDDIPF